MLVFMRVTVIVAVVRPVRKAAAMVVVGPVRVAAARIVVMPVCLAAALIAAVRFRAAIVKPMRALGRDIAVVIAVPLLRRHVSCSGDRGRNSAAADTDWLAHSTSFGSPVAAGGGSRLGVALGVLACTQLAQRFEQLV